MAMIFCDESGTTADSRILVLGSVTLEHPEKFSDKVERICEESHFHNEIHFVKHSHMRLRCYRKIMEELWEDDFKFLCLIFDKQHIDMSLFGRNKSLLLNNLTKLLIKESIDFSESFDEFCVCLDQRSHQKGLLEGMMEEISKICRTKIRRFEMMDSKRNRCLQFCDLLVSATHHFFETRLAPTNPEKEALSKFIFARLLLKEERGQARIIRAPGKAICP